MATHRRLYSGTEDDGDNLVITLQFWREEYLRAHPEQAGEVFTVELSATEFADILENLVATLDQG